jgi:hypothetical protein
MCQAVLRELNCAEVFRPLPTLMVCDGILPICTGLWLVGSNDRGRLTLHILEEVTKAEAWEFFESMRGVRCKPVNPRISFCGPLETAAATRKEQANNQSNNHT